MSESDQYRELAASLNATPAEREALMRKIAELGPPARPRYDHTDSTTNELRALGWSPDPRVEYGCGCNPRALCAGHRDRRAVEHYNPEWIPPVSKVGSTLRITRAIADGMRDVELERPIEQVWVGWFRQLRKTGHRPVGWPTLRRVWIAAPWMTDPDNPERAPLVVAEDSPQRDELRLIVEGPAVPL